MSIGHKQHESWGSWFAGAIAGAGGFERTSVRSLARSLARSFHRVFVNEWEIWKSVLLSRKKGALPDCRSCLGTVTLGRSFARSLIEIG